MKILIERLEVFVVEIPFVKPFKSATSLKTAQKSVIVKVTATGGVAGISSIEPVIGPHMHETAEQAAQTLVQRLGPAIIGLDPRNINRLLPALEAALPEPSDSMFAIEMACVDLTARSFGVPIYTYLGGEVTQQLEFNAWIGMLPPEQAAAEALHWLQKGFRSAKIKVGAGVDADYERVAAIRTAVGSAMALRIDANESYDAETSIRLARMLAPFKLQHFEQPAPRNDLAGLGRVRREGGIPVMADEALTDHASLVAVIKAGAADVIKVGLKKQGGFHRTRQMLATAEAAGIPCVVGHGFGIDISTLAETMLAATCRNVVSGLECVGPLKMSDSIVDAPLDISAGTLQLGPGVGLGLTLDEAKLERYRLEIGRTL